MPALGESGLHCGKTCRSLIQSDVRQFDGPLRDQLSDLRGTVHSGVHFLTPPEISLSARYRRLVGNRPFWRGIGIVGSLSFAAGGLMGCQPREPWMTNAVGVW